MNHSPLLNVAQRTARQAGNTARRLFSRPDELRIQHKGPHDLVSNADTQVEQEIIHLLKKGYPEIGILAEESGAGGKKSDPVWIIDPIDGTANFVHGVPHFALSIGLLQEGVLQCGVVYNPITDELFVAERGRGAFLNDVRIRVSPNRQLSQALLATGFPHKQVALLEPYLDSFRVLFPTCRGIRRLGSAALDLAYVAAGRFDGFWEPGLAAWDIAAGALLVREAGGFVTDFAGGDGFLTSGNVVAGNPGLHARILSRIQSTALGQATAGDG